MPRDQLVNCTQSDHPVIDVAALSENQVNQTHDYVDQNVSVLDQQRIIWVNSRAEE